jgi:hypothetical protein
MMKHLYVAIAVVVAFTVGYGVGSFKTAPAVAHAQGFAAAFTMCGNSGNVVPSGYVVVAMSNTGICTDPNGKSALMYQIEKPKAAGADKVVREVICTGTPVPTGFVTTGWNTSNVCGTALSSAQQQAIALFP